MEKAETNAVHKGGRNTRYQAIDRGPGGNMEWKSSLEGDSAIMYDRLGRGPETQRSETFWRMRGTLYRGGAEISGNNEGSFFHFSFLSAAGRGTGLVPGLPFSLSFPSGDVISPRLRYSITGCRQSAFGVAH